MSLPQGYQPGKKNKRLRQRLLAQDVSFTCAVNINYLNGLLNL